MILITNNFKVFNEVTEQLSHGSACISEVGNSVRKYILHFQVIPMVTIMMHSLERTEMDYGVIGWKANLKERITERLGNVEFEESYSVATLLDPRLICHPSL